MFEQTLKDKINKYLNKNYSNYHFLLSGRASIDLAIKNAILKNKNIKIAYLPNYICDSMVQPFIDNGVLIKYYKVNYDGKDFSVDFSQIKETDDILILYCDYFINNSLLYKMVTEKISKNTILIHDVTHTLFSKDYLDYRDDYLVCSIRKWFPIEDGGLFISKEPLMDISFKKDETYLQIKKSARAAKKIYYSNPTDKNRVTYEALSNKAEKCLNNNYSLVMMSDANMSIIDTLNLQEYFSKKRDYFSEILNLLQDYTLLNNANEKNCIFTYPLVNLKNRNELLSYFKDILIRCAVMWDYSQDKIYKDFVDGSICVDISENTIKQLRRHR